MKPANRKEDRIDRRYSRNQNGKRQCVVVIRERDGHIMPGAFRSEGAALSYIRNHVAAGAEIMADDANSWNDLHARYVVKRINHQVAYSLDGACTNGAESFLAAFAGLRLATITTSLEPTSPATRKRAHGVRAIAGTATGIRQKVLLGWR